MGDTSKQGLTRQVERRKDSIADRISGLAERAEHSAEELRDQEAWLAGLLGRSARELHSVADEIRGNDVASILGSIEVFARRQPALFTGAAVALGFALTRVVRGEAAASHRYNDDRGYDEGRGYGEAAASPQTPGYTGPAAGSAYELGSHARSGSNI